MHCPTIRLGILALTVLLSLAGEEHYARAQSANPVDSIWAQPERRRIVLMRHGDVSYFDAQGQPFANSDLVVLSEKGRSEADATGAYLKTIGLGALDRVVSSTLPRTIETAERVMRVLGQAGEPVEVEAFREIRIGTQQEIRAIPTLSLPQALLGMMQARVSGDGRLLQGESVASLQARVFPAADELLKDKGWQTALWVLHGGVNLAILGHALTGDASYYGRLDLGPGCFSIIDVGADFSDAVIKAVNVCPDPAPYTSRLDALETLLEANLKARASKQQATFSLEQPPQSPD